MDNGNTAIQVGPVPTEEDMGRLQETFKQALSAIVSMSALNDQVQALSKQVAELTKTVERFRSQNEWLDEQLVNVRKARDDALAVARQAKHEAEQVYNEAQDARREADQARERVAELEKRLADAMRERDDYGLRNMELDERLEAETRKATEVQQKLSELVALARSDRPAYRREGYR